jgi:nitroreductase
MVADSRTTAQVPAPVLRRAIVAATAAPSLHNTQPWLFRIRHDAIDVYVDRRRQLRTTDPQGREMHVSVGAALFNLRVAFGAQGWTAQTRLCPDPTEPDLAAAVLVTGSVKITPAARALASAIIGRHTNRRPFRNKAIPEPIFKDLAQAASLEGGRLVIADGALRDGVLSLTRTADNRLNRDAGHRMEIAKWTVPGGSHRRDGVPRGALGPRSRNRAVPLRDLALAHGAPTTIVEFEADPTIALLFTRGDSVADWLRAGSALERVWLTATVRELAGTPLTQLTEVPALRRLLDISTDGEVLQTVLRLGYPTRPCIATPRRRLSEVLIDGHD